MSIDSRPGIRAPGYRASLTALRGAQKPPVGTAAYSRYVNRPVGRRIAAAAHQVGMSPNTATAISALLSATAIVGLALVEPRWFVGPVVGALLALGYVMDSVDGQLARLSGSGSLSGEWLDHTVDTIKTCTLHVAVLISFYLYPPADGAWVLLVPLAFQVVQMIEFFGQMSMPALRARAGSTAERSGPVREHPLRKWALLPDDYGVLCWSFVLLGWGAGFLALYTTMLLVSAAIVSLAIGSWWRELRRADRAREARS